MSLGFVEFLRYRCEEVGKLGECFCFVLRFLVFFRIKKVLGFFKRGRFGF